MGDNVARGLPDHIVHCESLSVFGVGRLGEFDWPVPASRFVVHPDRSEDDQQNGWEHCHVAKGSLGSDDKNLIQRISAEMAESLLAPRGTDFSMIKNPAHLRKYIIN